MLNNIVFWNLNDGVDFVLPQHEGFEVHLSSFHSNSKIVIPKESTLFGFVLSGKGELRNDEDVFSVSKGCFFSRSAGTVSFSNVDGIAILQKKYCGLPLLSGPIENVGRLQYIDGCSDTLLIPPLVEGDPCLNHLHIPNGTNQTAHTHPSLRCGIIVKGTGKCRTPQEDVSLRPGMVFYIPKETVHSFITQDDSLDVIAFHPDSDFGPTNKNHPMINKTIIEGLSASVMSKGASE